MEQLSLANLTSTGGWFSPTSTSPTILALLLNLIRMYIDADAKMLSQSFSLLRFWPHDDPPITSSGLLFVGCGCVSFTKSRAAQTATAFLTEAWCPPLSSLFCLWQSRDSYRLLVFFCTPKIITRLPGPVPTSASSQPCPTPNHQPPHNYRSVSLKPGTMANWDRAFGGSSEQYFSGTYSTSGTSSSLAPSNLSYQLGEQGSTAASHSSGASHRPQSATHTSSTSAKSTESEGVSLTPCDGSVWSSPPHGSASRMHTGSAASASGLNGPILERFASRTPPASPTASPIRQITQKGSLSSSDGRNGSTWTDETDSRGVGLVLGLGRELGTPVTSDASQDAENISDLDTDDDEHAAEAGTGRPCLA